jgi:hypothetical protein
MAVARVRGEPATDVPRFAISATQSAARVKLDAGLEAMLKTGSSKKALGFRFVIWGSCGLAGGTA